jgi:hypothetical protein
VSSAIDEHPGLLALSSDGTIAFESFAVIMKPLAPAEIRFSMAWTWASLSPSCLPAKVCSCTPACSAAWVAPSFIFTKNGLVSVLVIRPTIDLFARGGRSRPSRRSSTTRHHRTRRARGRPSGRWRSRRRGGRRGRWGSSLVGLSSSSTGTQRVVDGTSTTLTAEREARHTRATGFGQAESRFVNDHHLDKRWADHHPRSGARRGADDGRRQAADAARRRRPAGVSFKTVSGW